jgi:hypothetical protein
MIHIFCSEFMTVLIFWAMHLSSPLLMPIVATGDFNEADGEKTAFTFHKGLHQFKRMPFALMTASATFQRAIDIFLSSFWFQSALTYLDDIVVYSPTFDQHLKDLSRVLQLFQDAGVTLKRSKCFFSELQVKYLGLKVSSAGVEVDDEKIASDRQAVPPTNKTGLRRFWA